MMLPEPAAFTPASVIFKLFPPFLARDVLVADEHGRGVVIGDGRDVADD